MAALDFPASPTLNQIYTANGGTWKWDGTSWISFNSLINSDITTALGYTPYNATNPSGYTTNTGTVTSVTGTAPIVSSGGATPAISITAATTLAAGSMSSADKVKLDTFTIGTGNVAIGTVTTSSARLAIVSAQPENTYRANSVAGTAAVFDWWTNTGGNCYFGIDNSTGSALLGVPYSFTMMTESARPLAFGTNFGLRMLIHSSGGISINNTTDPGAGNLSVTGKISGNLGLIENSSTIGADYTITTGNNAMSAGPVTVSNGITVTVPTGSTWVIV